MRKSAVFLLVLLLAAVSCRRHDIRTVLIRVPQMKNEVCVEEVRRPLARVDGVRKAETAFDLERRHVTVTYDSLKLSMKNIEFAVAEAGFAANEVPADDKARAALPEACR